MYPEQTISVQLNNDLKIKKKKNSRVFLDLVSALGWRNSLQLFILFIMVFRIIFSYFYTYYVFMVSAELGHKW